MDKMKEFKKKLDKLRPNRNHDTDLLDLPYKTTETNNCVQIMRELCVNLKKMNTTGLATNVIIEDEKKTKKPSLNELKALIEINSIKFPENDPIRASLSSCSESLMDIIHYTEELKNEITNTIMQPLEEIEHKCAEIQELFKKLNNLDRELTSAQERKTRYDDQVFKTGVPDEEKRKQIEMQIMELNGEIENITDQYLQKVFEFEADNLNNAEIFEKYMMTLKEYHDNCNRSLTDKLGKCREAMELKYKPVCFETALKTHLQQTGRTIAYPIEHCVRNLSNISSLQQEGLFRIPGSKTKTDLLCEIMNVMKFEEVKYDWPPNVLAEVLKRYLRKMPNHLLSCVSMEQWNSCYELYQKEEKAKSMWKLKEIITSMPLCYSQNVEYLLRFLCKVVAEDKYNKMNVNNICTVFIPNVFDTQMEYSGAISMDNNGCMKFVLETLLTKTDFFYPHSSNSGVQKRKKKINSIQKSVPKINIRRSEKCRGFYNSNYVMTSPTHDTQTNKTFLSLSPTSISQQPSPNTSEDSPSGFRYSDETVPNLF